MKPPSTARTAGRSDWAERRFRRHPFILLSFSSSKKARKAQETQSYQRFQCIGHTDFKGLSNAVTNTHPLLPSMGTTRQKSSCRNRLQNGPRSLSQAKVGTHSPLPTGSHTAAYTPKQGPSGRGRYHYPRSVPHVHKHPRAGCQNGKLCRFWVLAGCTPEGRRKPAGQRCAYARRCSEGVAAPLGCVIFLQFGDVAVFSLCTQYFTQNFLRVQDEGGITTLVLLRVLLKRWTAACQKGSFAAFCDEICQG